MAETRGVGAVVKAVRLLRVIAGLPIQERTLSTLARQCGMKAPSAHHLLSTLVGEGVLVKDGARRYHFGPILGVIAEASYRDTRPSSDLLAELHRLSDMTGESAYLSGWVRGEIQVLEEVSGTQAVRVQGLQCGSSGHAYARASGKVLLAMLTDPELDDALALMSFEPLTAGTVRDAATLRAQLAAIRGNGIAIERGEFVDDVACCAAPIFRDGTVTSAIAISAPLERFNTHEDKLVAAVRDAADRATIGTAPSRDEEVDT